MKSLRFGLDLVPDALKNIFKGENVYLRPLMLSRELERKLNTSGKITWEFLVMASDCSS